MKMNINDLVQVTLSERGVAVFAAYSQQLVDNGLQEKHRPVLTVDDKGRSTWMLWELMSLFGAFMAAGEVEVFESDIELMPQSNEPGYKQADSVVCYGWMDQRNKTKFITATMSGTPSLPNVYFTKGEEKDWLDGAWPPKRVKLTMDVFVRDPEFQDTKEDTPKDNNEKEQE